jgi:predicted DCC family thiol-disulfide oxidoreductase YuxK
VRGLTILFDPGCPICRALARWLVNQRQLVPLDFVAAGSSEAHSRFPGLDHAATLKEITVVGDGGQVYAGDSAWIACLWALARHRSLAYRLATPAGRPLAKASVLVAAGIRSTLAAISAAEDDACATGVCHAASAESDEERCDDGRREDEPRHREP